MKLIAKMQAPICYYLGSESKEVRLTGERAYLALLGALALVGSHRQILPFSPLSRRVESVPQLAQFWGTDELGESEGWAEGGPLNTQFLEIVFTKVLLSGRQAHSYYFVNWCFTKNKTVSTVVYCIT